MPCHSACVQLLVQPHGAGDTECCERSADKGFKAQPVLNQLIDCIRTYYNTEHLFRVFLMMTFERGV